MRNLSITITLALLSMGFAVNQNPPLNSSFITGKWRLDKIVVNGVEDTTRTEFRETYYTFYSADSVKHESVWRKFDDTLSFRGTYRLDVKKHELLMDFPGTKSGGATRIKELTATSLIFTTKYNYSATHSQVYDQYWIKIE